MGICRDCDPNPCGPTIGACCNLDTQECVVTTFRECLVLGEQYEYLGDGTDCDSNPCPAPVPTQISTWGRIKASYR